MSIETLVQKLKDLEACEEIQADDDWIVSPNENERHPLLRELDGLCDALLITSDGRCNSANISILKDKGFNVGPGETDSFGWITGIIYTKKGKFVYG